MARIKYFENEKIAIYIYGEKNERHHEKHLLVLKRDEECQYGFDGMPIKNSPALRKKSERELVAQWILEHQAQLEKAWEDVNNGIKPGFID